MNTQRQVFEKLAKQNLASKHKQNLGAIEDVINEVKMNIGQAEGDMERIVMDFNTDLDNSVGIINNEIETVKNYSADYDESFSDLLRMRSQNLEELKSAGIDYDESTLNQIIADYDRLSNSFIKIIESEIR